MERAVWVTYDGLLEPLGASQVVPYVEALARAGFRLQVLSFEKPSDLADGARLDAVGARLAGAGVPWTRLRYHRAPSLPATAWDVTVGVRALAGLTREGGPLLIHARSYVAGVMGLLARRRTGGRLLLDLRGFWVDERVEAKRWREGTPVVHLARRWERELLAGADHLVHLTRQGQEGAARLVPGLRLPPSTVVPTCVDLERFRPPADPAAARRSLELGAGPVVVHTGTLSGWYLGRDTVRVGGAFAARTGGTFVVLTRETELARRLLAEEGVEARVDSAAPEDVPRWLAAADAGLALVRPGFAKSASAPTKVGEYLAAGLAVAATPVGDLREQLAGSPVAFTVEVGDPPERTAERLAAAVPHPGRAGHSRALARTWYDLHEGARRYGEVYRRLGLRPSAGGEEPEPGADLSRRRPAGTTGFPAGRGAGEAER